MRPALGRFEKTISEVYGEAGQAWLDALPELLAECEQRWQLSLGPPFSPLNYNYVAPGLLADGSEIVLKLGVPNPELNSESESLQAFGGTGSVLLLDSDISHGILLLERLRPGTSLEVEADDELATLTAAEVMAALARPAPEEGGLRTAGEWASGLTRLRAAFSGGTGPLPPDLIGTAEGLFADLLSTETERLLIHGDLHHGNILAAQRRPWLAIDPKGLLAEREYEAGAILRNPLPKLLEMHDPSAVLSRRIDVLCERLGFDPQRVRAWAIAQAVLSAVWTLEDHGKGWEAQLEVARRLLDA